MILLILTVSILVGALIRRWWGGWFAPNHFVKLFVVALVYGLLSYWASGLLLMSVFSGLCATIIFTNTLHGEGMNMGYENTPTPLWKCLIIMSGSYAGYMLCEGLVWSYFYANYWHMLYSCFGLCIALCYWMSWKFYPRKPDGSYKIFLNWPTGNVFLDGPCAVGELCLGAIVFSSMFLLHFLLTI